MLTRHDQNRRRILEKLLPLYGSDPANPIGVDGVMPLTLAITGGCAVLFYAFAGGLFLILTPFIFLLVLRVMRGQRAKDVSEEMAARARNSLGRALGRELVYADFSATASARRRGVVASGLAYDGKFLYAIEESLAERIAWSQVRRFEWKIEADTATEVHVNVHAPGAMHMPDLNAGAARISREAAAMRRSGFFLHVADVERPVRHFVTSNQAVLQKWFEILTQMKEGRLAVG